jgi:hypothetical protein
MFYPERNTLAYSETLLVPGIIAAPLHWLGVGAVLIYNLVFLSGFALSGVGVALLVRRLTGHSGAAILSGIIFAFLPFRIDHYPHLQLQQTQFIPLAMRAFHRLMDTDVCATRVAGRLRGGPDVVACYGLFLIPYMTAVCGTILPGNDAAPPGPAAVAAAIVVVAMIPRSRLRGRAERRRRTRTGGSGDGSAT